MTHTRPLPAADINDTVERILAAAESLFAEKGFDACAMNAIAERAGISKANLYHHFGSKDALYLAVVKSACQRSLKILDAVGKASGHFQERISHFASAHLDDLLEHDSITRLVMRQILDGETDKTTQLAEQVLSERFTRIVDMVRQAQQRGEVREEVDPAMIATTLVGANVFYFLSKPIQAHLKEINYRDQPELYTRQVLDIMLNGVLKTKPQPRPLLRERED